MGIVFALFICINATGQCTPVNGFSYDDTLTQRVFSMAGDCATVAKKETESSPITGVEYRCVPTAAPR